MRLNCIIISISILLFGCQLFQNQKVTLVTNKPEILAYIETFNAGQDRYRIEPRYSSTPESLLNDKEEPADVLIGEWLATPLYMEKCESLNSLLTNKKINPDLFYPELLQMGIYEKEQKLLPLNFNLPGIIYSKKADITISSDILIHIDNMKTECADYNLFKGDKLLKTGFSPFWNDDFIYLTANLYGTNFSRGSDNRLTWDNEALLKATAFLKEWINEIPGGYAAERTFSEKYFNAPPYQLINENKILYYYLNSRDLYNIPQEQFESIDFRWFSYNNKIAVHDNVLFIGIPRKGKNKKGGKEFLSWIFNPVIQEKLLEINHFKKLDSVFGIAGGFSSLKELNLTSLPQHYPLFVNHIPLSDSLIFPGNFPDHWPQIKRDYIKTWLIEAITTENFDKKLEDQLIFFEE